MQVKILISTEGFLSITPVIPDPLNMVYLGELCGLKIFDAGLMLSGKRIRLRKEV
jgi:hypothetical protein